MQKCACVRWFGTKKIFRRATQQFPLLFWQRGRKKTENDFYGLSAGSAVIIFPLPRQRDLPVIIDVWHLVTQKEEKMIRKRKRKLKRFCVQIFLRLCRIETGFLNMLVSFLQRNIDKNNTRPVLDL